MKNLLVFATALLLLCSCNEHRTEQRYDYVVHNDNVGSIIDKNTGIVYVLSMAPWPQFEQATVWKYDVVGKEAEVFTIKVKGLPATK